MSTTLLPITPEIKAVKNPKRPKKVIDTSEFPTYTYTDYKENVIPLKKWKAAELKHIAKINRLHVTGNKQTIIDRIFVHFHKIDKAVRIQAVFRKHLVQKLFRLRGPAFRNRSLCVNETDFYTLEPLNDVPHEQFYSYADDSSFVYGFNIYSLITLLRKKGKIVNPYNREKLNVSNQENIISIYRIMRICFPDSEDENEKSATEPVPLRAANVVVSNAVTTPSNNAYQRLETQRLKPIPVRVQDLFFEIDQLGNYTNREWFSNLERRELIQFYLCMFEVWNFRGMMSADTKNKISPIDPFLNVFENRRNLNIRAYFIEKPTDEIQEGCLRLCENLVYPGVDIDFRRLGALHVLRCLTVVSVPARTNMMWLYESLE